MKHLFKVNNVLNEENKKHPKVFLVYSFSIAFVLLFISSLYYLFNAPVLGIKTSWDETNKRWNIVSATEPSLLKDGDAILTIGDMKIDFHHLLTDNIYINSRSELFAWFEAKRQIFGELSKPSLSVFVERDGRLVHLSLAPEKMGFSFLKKIELLHLVVGIAFFLIGIIVLLRKGHEEQGLIFSLMCMSMTLVYITNATSLLSEIVYVPAYFSLMNIINTGNFFLAPALLLHFSLLLPEKRKFLVRFPWLVVPFYAFCAVVALTFQLSVINLAVPLFFLMSLISIAYAFFAYRRQPIERQQMKWVAAGFGFGIFPWVALNGIPLLVTGSRLMNDTIPGSFLIFIPLFIAFAIQKYRLMDIDTIFDNTIIYTVTLGIFVLLDVSVVGLLAGIQDDTFQIGKPVSTFLAIGLVIFAYAPVRKSVNNAVKRLLKREIYDLNEVTMRLSGNLLSAQNTGTVFKKLQAVLDDTLHPQGGLAYLYQEKQIFTLDSASAGEGNVGRLGLLEPETLRSGPRHLFTLPLAPYLPNDYSLGVLVPLVASSATLGYLLLKNKHSGRPYGLEDMRLMSTLANQAALAIEGIYHIREAARKEKEAYEEKQRISREIHDGIGSSFSNSIMLLDLIRNETLPIEAANRQFAILKELLNDGLLDLRDLLWAEGGKDSSLEDLAAYIEEKVGRLSAGEVINIEIKKEVENESHSIPSQVSLNIVRIVQEAIANAVKHAGASMIEVAVVEKAGKFQLSIKDNGKGFDLANPRPKGHGLKNMQKRCDEMGAGYRIYSGPGKGTEVVVDMALATASPLE